MKTKSVVYQRHLPLIEAYTKNPELALITDKAEVIGENLGDPFRTKVSINEEMKVPFQIGVHRAIGGDHDFPNPGDLLCATLASCFESTLRMIAGRLNIKLEKTSVKASALVDVRGTLMIDPSVPVGFQRMHLEIEVMAESVKNNVMVALLKATKHSCVIYQTLKKGTPIEVDIKILQPHFN